MVALLGTSLPPAFVVLIYIVVIFALVVAALPAIRTAWHKPGPTSATRSSGVDGGGGSTHI